MPTRRTNPATDPGKYLLEETVRIVGGSLLRKLQSTMTERLQLPPGIDDLKAQASLRRSELALKRERRRMVLDERKMAASEARAAIRLAETQGKMILVERRARLYDLAIVKAELVVAQAQQRLEAGVQSALPAGSNDPIRGALDFRADPSGISGEVRSGYLEWLDSLELGKVILILGKRGAGKTVFAFKLGEYVFAVHQVPVWVVGLPQEISAYLPRWISIAEDIDQVPLGAFIIVDESGLQYMAMRYQSDSNTIMRRLLMIARHRKQSLVFITQVASDVDKSVVRQADCIVFKQPTLMQPKNDRPEVRDPASRALKVFEPLPKDEKLRTAFVCDSDFNGVLQYELPDYWREELSFAFANVPLNEGKTEANTANVLAEMDEVEMKRRALEMRRDGMSQTKIAGELGVGRKRIRIALDGVEGPTSEN